MRLQRFIGWAILLSCSAGGVTTRAAGQDWDKAEAAIRRLPPSAFPTLPPDVRRVLEVRECRIPQTYTNPTPHNVILGEFTSSGQTDIAVLCSRDGMSKILVFRGGRHAAPIELEPFSDRTFLQTVDDQGTPGYSRAIGVARKAYILNMHAAFGGPDPPRVDRAGARPSRAGGPAAD